MKSLISIFAFSKQGASFFIYCNGDLSNLGTTLLNSSVADPHKKNADADADPGKNLDADADPDADSCPY